MNVEELVKGFFEKSEDEKTDIANIIVTSLQEYVDMKQLSLKEISTHLEIMIVEAEQVEEYELAYVLKEIQTIFHQQIKQYTK